MLAVVFVLCLVTVTSAAEVKCSEQANTSALMRPADDGVKGRYIAQVCVEKKPDINKWMIDLSFNDHVRSCNNTHHSLNPGRTHSSFTVEDINKWNCSHVCLHTKFEMVFSSCYVIKSVLQGSGSQLAPFDSYFNISNKFNYDYFIGETYATTLNHEKDTSVSFFGRAPLTEYSVELSDANKTSANSVMVTDNCTATEDSAKLACTLWVVEGCYLIRLRHLAPWTNGCYGDYSIIRHVFCRSRGAEDAAARGGRDWSLAWWCGGAVLALGGAVLAWRARHHRHLHKRVLRYWTQHSASAAEGAGVAEAAGAEAAGAGGARRVLLLYAREGELGQRLVDALRDLLQQHHVQVQDLFSAESVRAASAAPHAWVAAALRSAPVLLLQTPALAALYEPRAPPAAPAATATCAPLLGAGAVYRTPHFGDALLQYALRLLQDRACHHTAYRHYYLATLSECPTEVLPTVVPFRRYLLPGAARALAADVCGAAGGAGGAGGAEGAGVEAAAREVAAAAAALARRVREAPHYLAEELLLL